MKNVQVIQGDITQIPVDAIVNAANTSLLGGGGVDGAIYRAGGPAILEDCRKIIAKQGGCKTGEAVITTAGLLPATYVIHTVGPVWNGGHRKEEEKLRSCYKECLQLALQYQCKRVSFPAISTGIYKFPKNLDAQIAVECVYAFLSTQATDMEVVFVCFDEENYSFIKQEIQQRMN